MTHRAGMIASPGRWRARLGQARRALKRGSEAWGDASLSLLLAVQAFTFFVALPIGAIYPGGRALLDLSDLAFAVVCVVALTRHTLVRGALIAGLALFTGAPTLEALLAPHVRLAPEATREGVALIAFGFIALVTLLVARQVFGPGRVTGHRVRGAILVYLNVGALFAIIFGMVQEYVPGSIAPTGGGALPTERGARIAELYYFSMATITTTGYGDLAPVHPFARSLANLEAVFGQLFPATVLARLIGLHLAHGRDRPD